MQTWKLICSNLASGDDDQDEIYVRGCGLAFNYDDEEDSCVRYGKWNEEHRECVCDEDECNGAGVSKASVAMLAVASVSVIIVRSFKDSAPVKSVVHLSRFQQHSGDLTDVSERFIQRVCATDSTKYP